MAGETLPRSASTNSGVLHKWILKNVWGNSEIDSKYAVHSVGTLWFCQKKWTLHFVSGLWALSARILAMFGTLCVEKSFASMDSFRTVKDEASDSRQPTSVSQGMGTDTLDFLFEYVTSKNIQNSPFKSLTDLLLDFSKNHLKSEGGTKITTRFCLNRPYSGNFVRHLAGLGFIVEFRQQACDELDLVVQNIAVDLRDGTLLTKLAEVFGLTSGLLKVNNVV